MKLIRILRGLRDVLFASIEKIFIESIKRLPILSVPLCDLCGKKH
jgi:hypothetical protein